MESGVIEDLPPITAKLLDDMEAEFVRRTPKSERAWRRRSAVAGVTRGPAYGPYAIFGSHAKGCTVHDLDDNMYYDFSDGATALIHGYAHPVIAEAIADAYAKGSQTLRSALHVSRRAR